MRQLLVTSLFASLFLYQQPALAQENKKSNPGLQNTVWKSFIGPPVGDTMVIRYTTDSMFLQTKNDETLVAATFTIAGDTVTMNDVSGQIACLGHAGKYKFVIAAESIKFDLIEDAGRGRVGAMTTAQWQRVK